MPHLTTRLSPLATARSQLGCWLNERWQTEFAMLRGAASWLDLCNRNEQLTIDKVSGGRICHWRDSSQLTVSRIFPNVGCRLLRHCVRQWPLRLHFDIGKPLVLSPKASVLIAIGGTDRLPQFRTVLASLRGQACDSQEIIVVEQSHEPELEKTLPSDVRYIHDPQPVGVEFNKSRALNVAARQALGRYLLIHDADYVVPQDYVGECCRVLRQVQGIRPSRLNFHLNQESTKQFTSRRQLPSRAVCDFIVQNNPTPMAVRAECYGDIGGHDESFIGWGGEDVEFLSRLRTRTVSEGGWLPVIHLWHPPAPRKASGDRNQQQQDELLGTDPAVRIEHLRSLYRTPAPGAVTRVP